jgi:hypothetical protein
MLQKAEPCGGCSAGSPTEIESRVVLSVECARSCPRNLLPAGNNLETRGTLTRSIFHNCLVDPSARVRNGMALAG